MNNNKQQIIERFKQVKALGFIKSNRKNNTGIGKTFEDYIGVLENNIDEPDLFGYEIKSHREETASYITLFTKSPNFPRKANSYLRDKYGMPYEDNTDLKKLHTSMFASKYNSFGNVFSFRLINDRNRKAVKIGIYDLDTKRLIDDTVGYRYDCLDKILNRKLKNLFYVSAERQTENGDEYFFFNKAEIYSHPTLEKFLTLIDDGLIMFDIRIGSYRSGKNYGKTHDHGSGFRILESNLRLLFSEQEYID
ncbi:MULTISPECIES: MvaI/BcnI family restriction endonuclease [Prevotellaceae]|uniref:MvaI/BcnI family restriction endonuclease n=1 Tax=Prevotellaceae TaxID=171552 RepID=UPI0003D2FCF5|nr:MULTISPECIES: MvaI/BcnI family restriction endonuclease [Prevotellaceae]ETD21611.1 hypothetical protein HMPREF1199_00686 [Hoylesella oralis CC98A]